MNYTPFLNKSTKFKNQNRYRPEKIKKRSSTFFLFSIVSVAVLTGLLTLLPETAKSIISTLQQTAETTTIDTESVARTAANKENMPLALPEIAYASEVLSESVTYIETENNSVEEKVDNKSSELKSLIAETPQTRNPVKATHTTSLESLVVTQKNDLTKPEKRVPAVEITSKPEVIAKATPLISIKSSRKEEASTKEVTNSLVEAIKPTESVSTQNLTTIMETKTTKTIVVKKGDTLSAIFKRLSLSSNTLYQIMNANKQAKQLTKIKPGQKIVFSFNSNNKFESLSYDLDRVDTLIITKKADSKKYAIRVESKEIDIKQQFATGTITNSLFAAGNKAGLSNAMIMKLAQLFGWDVDFSLDIRKGDTFFVLFEEKYIDDKKIGTGNILTAEFVNRGKAYKAIRYTDASGYTDYYSEKGLSMRKAFLRSPVDFSRISSRFSSSRKHPVLNKIRAHKGVDYAASRGTPIKAVGKGKVIFKGRKGGYGNVVILQHGSKYTTLYAHMKSYSRKIKRGSRVEQGQTIGYVGSSGLATGPHLHYEFRINGVHRNPLTVPLPSASPIAKKYRTDFKNTADTMISQLKLRKQETVALTEQ